MSVLIKGIKVHRGRCWECPCLDGEYGDCNVLEKDVHDIEYEECPIIEIPDHGDLIERDRLHHDLKADAIDKFAILDDTYLRYLEGLEKAEELLLGATVVIPAERSEDEAD